MSTRSQTSTQSQGSGSQGSGSQLSSLSSGSGILKMYELTCGDRLVQATVGATRRPGFFAVARDPPPTTGWTYRKATDRFPDCFDAVDVELRASGFAVEWLRVTAGTQFQVQEVEMDFRGYISEPP